MWNRIADLWCRKMHTDAMWPIHGKYVCKRCLREHPVVWEGQSLSDGEGSAPGDSPLWLPNHR
jgi:hypothetical protein